jgi:hypothetical protein
MALLQTHVAVFLKRRIRKAFPNTRAHFDGNRATEKNTERNYQHLSTLLDPVVKVVYNSMP